MDRMLEVSGVLVTFEQLENFVREGHFSVHDAQKALSFPTTIVAHDMKLTSKNLERVLKDAFDESLIITEFNKRDKLVNITWVPDNGPIEYGQYSHYESAKTSVKVENSYPASFDAWTKIFRAVELFFSECDACLYVIRFTDWDGEIEHLFDLFKTLRVVYDAIDNSWHATIDSSIEIGPAIHSRSHSTLIIALCEAVTDKLLFSEWTDERQGSEIQWNDLTNFHEWKKYKMSV